MKRQPNTMDIVQNKQNSRKPKIKQFREFYLNRNVAVRNYTPEGKWKIDKIIARSGKFHYKIKVDQTIWKRHVEQITNVGSHKRVTEFEAEDKNISTGTLKRQPKLFLG